MPMHISRHDVLIIVDAQNDFCAGGALGVPQGEVIMPVVNRIAQRFAHVLATQDWHPPGHLSFASRHEGRKPFEQIEAIYGAQTLWPDHCVQGTRGAEFHGDLDLRRVELVVRKGFRAEVDSYSAFYENDQRTPTGLAGYLREREFRRVFLAGLATDYCVHYSALDARREGFDVVVIEGACRAIDLEGSLARAFSEMNEAGVRRAWSEEFDAA